MPVTEVEGRRLKLSNLDKVLWPEHGFTKGEALHYYAQVADVLLPHVHDRAVSFLRFPDGVDGERFFAKNAPAGTPEWVRVADVELTRSTVHHVLVQDLPTLLWAANLAALELHVPQWKALDGRAGKAKVRVRADERPADRIVFDLDPGPPATVVECCRAALLVREALRADGLDAWPKTSGSKGLHLYVPLAPASADATSAYAKALARRLEEEHPKLILHRMARKLRPRKVFVDWSQNSRAKTTVAPYVLRAKARPTVSTPLTWDEVEACADPDELVFLPGDVLERIGTHGDLLESLLTEHFDLPDMTD
ncbi:non-homologous end-joining DNA ligase [Streptomyces sp. WMMC500]|uniref:non-homologous end-joining DNA ligase n=1 Tax=Streptomyces sp. WMMC500 TaxID=3015154 RepID=UPI00248BF14F|nr:non-homologous end-joining DNA ligase [Streptomyces sp. WMMC500]WBB59725.1 non-homologous end-joining DNA ligase [Streptomyces sp. WMMC500]